MAPNLGVARLAHFERGADPALDKREVSSYVQGPCAVAVLTERADEARQSDDPAIRKQLRNFGDTTNIFLPIYFQEARGVPGLRARSRERDEGKIEQRTFLAEAKVLVKARAHVIAIEAIAGYATTAELCLKGKCHGRLASPR